MGRYVGPSCRLCRREGVKLMLKGVKCETAKCQIERRQRNVIPGMHGWRRPRLSEYGVRLREKQKVRRYYGMDDKQFMIVFHKAKRMKGDTGQTLLQLLERRLDNVIYKLNFASSRKAGRQMINHGHICVNGRKVDIASYTVDVGDKITIKDSVKTQKFVKKQIESNADFAAQNWLQLDRVKPQASIVSLPSREDVQIPVEEELVVEFCSR